MHDHLCRHGRDLRCRGVGSPLRERGRGGGGEAGPSCSVMHAAVHNTSTFYAISPLRPAPRNGRTKRDTVQMWQVQV